MSRLVKIILNDAERVATRIDLSALDGRSILVTGASGLLGLTLLGCLKHRSITSGRPMNVTAVVYSPIPDYLRTLFNSPGLRVCIGDLSDHAFCQSLPLSDVIIHAAGYGQPGKFMKKPSKTILINTTATALLLEKLTAGGNFLFLSSSEIYSGSSNVPHQETDIGTTGPDHPRACYIEGKRCGEAICHAYRLQGVDVKMARLALAYGPGVRLDDQRVLNNLINKALVEQRIELRDYGKAGRTYGYITDVIEMLLGILLSGQHAVYNVGGMSSVTIFELAQAIGDIVGVPVVLPEEDNNLSGAPCNVALDLSLACREFGKSDFIALKDGLQRTIDWQRELLHISK